MNRWLWLAPLAAAVLAAIVFVVWATRQDDLPAASLIGSPIPETVLPMLSGATAGPGMVDLKTAGVGRPMLVNVFASWCAPCEAEHPRLMALKAEGVAIVGVAVRDDPAATRAFLDRLGDPYAMVLVDARMEAARALGVDGPPATFAVDARGRVTAVHPGPLVDRRTMDDLVASMQAPARPLPTARRR